MEISQIQYVLTLIQDDKRVSFRPHNVNLKK